MYSEKSSREPQSRLTDPPRMFLAGGGGAGGGWWW